MFKLHNRTYKTIRKKISSYTIIILLCFQALPIYANTAIDTAVFDKRLENKEKTIPKKLPKNLSEGDLYRNIRQLTNQESIGGIQEGVASTYATIIEQFPSCNGSIRTSDIHTILYHTNDSYHDEVLASIYNTIPGRNNRERTALAQTCEKLVQCINQDTTTNITTNWINTCNYIVNNTYELSKEFGKSSSQLINNNHGIQLFENGTLDDSSFDLLLDIETIAKILFSANKPAPEIIYYQIPTLQNLPTATVDNSDDPTVATPSNTGYNSEDSNNEDDNNSPNPDQQTGVVINPEINQSDPNFPNKRTRSEQQLERDLQDLINNQETQQEAEAGTPQIDLRGINACQTDTNITGDLAPDQIPREDYTQILDDFIQTFDREDRLNNILSNPNNGNTGIGNTTGVNTTGNNQDGSTGSNNDTDNELPDPENPEQALACLDQCTEQFEAEKAGCNQLGGIAKTNCNYSAHSNNLICKAQCLCGIAPETIPPSMEQFLTYRVRYCMIPSQQQAVVRNKKVLSIEEIVDQINTTLQALKDSGQLGKHTQIKEFLDSSLSKIKLKNFFTFTIAVSFKPVFNSIADQVKSISLQEKNEQKKKELLKKQQKNRYVSLYDYETQIADKTTTISPLDYNDNIEQLRQIQIQNQTSEDELKMRERTLRQEHHAIMSDTIGEFLINNIAFREKINIVMQDIREITASMKSTIEKGS